MKEHLSLSAEAVRERINVGDGDGSRDLWSYVLRSEGKRSLTLGEMEVNAALVLIAATEPLSDALCGVVYYLAI